MRAWIRSFRVAATAIRVEKFVQLGIADHAGKTIELAVARDLGRNADEGVHRDPGERTADADPAHAHRRQIVDGEAESAAIEKIDRFRRHRLYHGLDLLARLDARRIETIRAGILIGAQPTNDV